MLAVQKAESSLFPLTPCLLEVGEIEILELIRRRWLAALGCS